MGVGRIGRSLALRRGGAGKREEFGNCGVKYVAHTPFTAVQISELAKCVAGGRIRPRRNSRQIGKRVVVPSENLPE